MENSLRGNRHTLQELARWYSGCSPADVERKLGPRFLVSTCSSLEAPDERGVDLRATLTGQAAPPGTSPATVVSPDSFIVYSLPVHRAPQGALRVGRDPSADVCLNERRVSRSHAELGWRGGELVVTDLYSHNGTWVDERRVAPDGDDAELVARVGNRLRFGAVDCWIHDVTRLSQVIGLVLRRGAALSP